MQVEPNGNPHATLTPDRKRAPFSFQSATATVMWRSVLGEVVFRVTEEYDARIFEDGSVVIV